MSTGHVQRLKGRVAVVTGGGAGKIAVEQGNVHHQASLESQP